MGKAHRRLWILGIVLSSLGITGFGAGDALNGAKTFRDPGKGTNGLACSNCHDIPETANDGLLRPAHSMVNVLGRPSYWGGTVKTFAEAVDFCAGKYLQTGPFSEADKADLESYVAQFGTAPQPPLPLAKRTRKELADVAKLIPDPERGRQIAETTCMQCHGRRGPGPQLDETLSPSPIIMVVVSTGGKIMPFFSTDRLNDQQVADVAAYVAAHNRSSH